MNVDAMVSDDLHALAAASRRGVSSVDDTLRGLGAEPARVARGAEATRAVPALALVALSQVYTRRYSGAARGAVLLAFTAFLYLVVADPGGMWQANEPRTSFECVVEGLWGTSVVALAAVLCTLASAVAARMAEAQFEAHVGAAVARGADARAAGRELVDGIDARALLLAIAGVVTFTTFLCVVLHVVGSEQLSQFWEPSQGSFDAARFFGDRLRDLAIVLPLLVVGAYAVARGARRRGGVRLLESWRTFGLASVLLLATVASATFYDAGTFDDFWTRDIEPSSCLRTLLAFTGAFSLFVVTSSLVLARRRGELARLATPGS